MKDSRTESSSMRESFAVGRRPRTAAAAASYEDSFHPLFSRAALLKISYGSAQMPEKFPVFRRDGHASPHISVPHDSAFEERLKEQKKSRSTEQGIFLCFFFHRVAPL